ncbi:MAG: hypothetical protein N2444_08665, partial [Methylocystis sp.]|nr:hypothetical protein [Methylocystis sp.]
MIKARSSCSNLSSALALAALVGLAGCSRAMNDVTDSIRNIGSFGRSANVALPTEEGALRRFSEEWGRRYEANPKDKNTALTYA